MPFPVQQTLWNQPKSGQLVFRNCPAGMVVLGCLHFDAAVDIQESFEYAAMVRDEALYISRVPVEAKLPEELASAICSVSDMARMNIWHGTRVPGTFTVRMIRAFEETNSWVVVGVTMRDIAEFVPNPLTRDAVHIIRDIESGKLTAWKAQEALAKADLTLAKFTGNCLSSILRDMPIWYNANRTQRYTLPALATQWRSVMHQHAELVAQVGEGLIDQAMYLQKGYELAKTTPAIRSVLHQNLDPFFAQFCAHRKAHGTLEVERAIPAEEYIKREQHCTYLIEMLLKD